MRSPVMPTSPPTPWMPRRIKAGRHRWISRGPRLRLQAGHERAGSLRPPGCRGKPTPIELAGIVTCPGLLRVAWAMRPDMGLDAQVRRARRAAIGDGRLRLGLSPLETVLMTEDFLAEAARSSSWAALCRGGGPGMHQLARQMAGASALQRRWPMCRKPECQPPTSRPSRAPCGRSWWHGSQLSAAPCRASSARWGTT